MISTVGMIDPVLFLRFLLVVGRAARRPPVVWVAVPGLDVMDLSEDSAVLRYPEVVGSRPTRFRHLELIVESRKHGTIPLGAPPFQ